MAEEIFHTSLEYMQARFDVVGRQMALRATTPQELAAWQAELRARLVRLIALDSMIPAPLQPKTTERVVCDGYDRERVEVQTEPGVIMPLYALIPQDQRAGERRPCIIAPHGHGSGGKLAVAGRQDIPTIEQTIIQHNYDYGVQLVRQGFIVFCPDARGFGERRELARQGQADLTNSSCNLLNHMALPLGQTVTGMWTWDLMRLIDYIETRSDCDATYLGCAGLSGGGLQTLWLSALDQRVKAAVVSGYFYGYKESLLVLNDNCSCNYVPGLWQLADMGDIGALMAPRPLLIETGTRDALNGASGVGNVLSQVESTRRAYRLLGAERNLAHDVFEGEHRWNGIQAIPFLKHHLAM
jgi:dienelactone hydrolase